MFVALDLMYVVRRFYGKSHPLPDCKLLVEIGAKMFFFPMVFYAQAASPVSLFHVYYRTPILIIRFRSLLFWGGSCTYQGIELTSRVFTFDLGTYNMTGNHKRHGGAITNFPEFITLNSNDFPNLVCEIAN